MISIPPEKIGEWIAGPIVTAIALWAVGLFRKAIAQFPTEARFKKIMCDVLTDADSPFRKIMHEENERSNDLLVTKRLDARYVLLDPFNKSVAQIRHEIETIPERMARHTGNNLSMPISAVLEGIDSLQTKINEMMAGSQKDREG